MTRRGLLFALALLSLAAPADAQDRTAIQGVITAQIEAFGQDDGTRAFGFATPELQAMFGSAERFMGMVRNGYQPVYRPRSMSFGDLTTANGQIVQELAVIGPDGTPRVALYRMEQQPDGTWRIAACQLLERPSPES
jgi:hypothetical protein